MTATRGKTFGLMGALAAFPRRLAAREVERQGGLLQRGVTRRTSYVVFGRGLLDRVKPEKIEARVDAAGAIGRKVLSENGFLRLLGLLNAADASDLTRQSLLEQSRLPAPVFDLLALFDAFERDGEPFSFRDLILAKKYAGLVAGGANWFTIARSVHRSGPVASLTALSLHADRKDAIYARAAGGLSELDGQGLLPFDPADDGELEELFALAEEAEDEHRYAEAAALYQRYLAMDPGDAIANFNRANCLRAAGDGEAAVRAFMAAIKRDAKLVEAWFNLAGLFAAQGKVDTARRHLERAIVIDKDYADAVFNLANLEYEAGDIARARQWWARYLELDSTSEWARTAARGVQYADLHSVHKKTAS